MEQAHFIQTVTESIPELIGIFEIPSRKVLYWNHHPYLFTGFTTQDVVRMNPDERGNILVYPEDRQAVNEFYERLGNLKGGEVTEVEYRFKKKQDGEFWVHVKGAPFQVKDGKVLSTICISRDISEEKKAKQQIIRLQEETQSFLLKFSEVLQVAQTPAEVACAAVALLSERLDADRCYVTAVDTTNGNAEMIYQYFRQGLEPMPHSIRMSEFSEAANEMLNATMVLDDIAGDSRLTETTNSCSIRSILVLCSLPR